MGVAENVKVTTAFEEAFNDRDWERLGQALAESVVVIDPVSPEPIQGRNAVVKMFQTNVDYFPTARIEGVLRFGDGDWVCVENVETGSQRDSKKQYRIDTCYTLKVLNEQLAEIRFYYDALGMQTQPGLSP